MTQKKTKLDWQIDENCQERAGKQADDLIVSLGLVEPIDPLEVARSEHPILATGGRDLGELYDGKLKFNKQKKRYLLFYNTKYDKWEPDGRHHPRTRFSIGHELGHYFIDAHRKHLRDGGVAHPSRGEFLSGEQVEREADAFASSLLLPTHLAEPRLNSGELSIEKIDRVATDFRASLLCTAIRGVRLCDQPCAVAGLREGRIAWMFPSKRLIEAKCYPPGKIELDSPVAKRAWAAFEAGSNERSAEDGLLRHWFKTYARDEELAAVEITEAFMPIRIMKTLVVLLTMDDDALFKEEEEEEEDEIDTNHRAKFGW
jgi:IrrE N-terminal-like domain